MCLRYGRAPQWSSWTSVQKEWGLPDKTSHGKRPRCRALCSAGIPAVLEPSGLLRSDGKPPDRVSLIPWFCGKALVWDFTSLETFAASHLINTSRIAWAAASEPENKRNTLHTHQRTFLFLLQSRPWMFGARVLQISGTWVVGWRSSLATRRLRQISSGGWMWLFWEDFHLGYENISKIILYTQRCTPCSGRCALSVLLAIF